MKVVALVLGAFAAMVIAGVALAGSSSTQDQGRRLTGPFCINKKTGVILSVAATQPCKAGYIRKLGAKVTGPKGDTGDTGPQGPKGDTGAKGDKGDTGAPGQTLVASGTPGKDGKDGKNAVGMITGVNSQEEGPCLFGGYVITFDVFNAVSVCNGLPGPPGIPGMPGTPGTPGTPGQQGNPGAQGDPGPQGPQGDPGPKGDIGPQGPQGEPGPKGDKGDAWTPDYAAAQVNVARGAGDPATWAQYSTTLGSPYGDTTGGTFRFTCNVNHVTCKLSIAAIAPAGYAVMPRVLIHKQDINGGPSTYCEYGDGATNSTPFEPVGPSLTMGIGGSLDCPGTTQAYPAGGTATYIEVPVGYYDVSSSFVFIKQP